MTGIRTSAIFRPEKSYGVSGTGDWYRFPSGLTISYNPTNNIRAYNEIGTKFISRAVADKYNCTLTTNFKLDYKCIQILGAIFEGYSYDSSTKTHKFWKSNSKRVKSMEVKLKKLNRLVGGSKDETITLKGCYVTSFTFRNTSGATLDAEVSYNCIMDASDYIALDSTDWDTYYDDMDACVPIEWACISIGNDPVAYTDSVTFSVNNNAESVYGCGSRFVQNYLEKTTSISCSTSCYSVNPEYYRQRMYSGGVDATHSQPIAKGLKPIPQMKIRSFYDAIEGGDDEYTCTVNLYNVWVNSMGTISFDAGRKITDSPNLIIQNFDIEIKNDTGSIEGMWNPTQ